jgi:hypothetical protein
MSAHPDFRPDLLTLDEAALFLQMSTTQLQELVRTHAIQACERDTQGRPCFTHRAIITYSTARLRSPRPAA